MASQKKNLIIFLIIFQMSWSLNFGLALKRNTLPALDL